MELSLSQAPHITLSSQQVDTQAPPVSLTPLEVPRQDMEATLPPCLVGGATLSVVGG